MESIIPISVLITTYNCGQYIRQTIKSILNQTYPISELVIIDDGSEDDTMMIVSEFNDPRIVFRKYEHIGRSKALNIGLKTVKCEWVAPVDADDLWAPTKLSNQILQITSERDFIFTDSVYFRSQNVSYLIPNFANGKELIRKIALHGHLAFSSVLFNKNCVEKVGGFDEKLSNSEDYDLWLRIFMKYSFKNVNECLTFIRIRENSLSRSGINNRNKIIRELQQKYDLIDYTGLSSLNSADKVKLRGWREYFYGSKKTTRIEWSKISITNW